MKLTEIINNQIIKVISEDIQSSNIEDLKKKYPNIPILDSRKIKSIFKKSNKLISIDEKNISIDLDKLDKFILFNNKTNNGMLFIETGQVHQEIKGTPYWTGKVYKNDKYGSDQLKVYIYYTKPKDMEFEDQMHLGYHGRLD